MPPRYSYSTPKCLNLIALSISLCFELCNSWQKWDSSSFSTDDWRELWSLSDGPGARRGHSLVIFNKTKVVLFGGRGNDAHRKHVPSRYNVVEDRGLLEFSTYDSFPLSSSYDPESEVCKPMETCTRLKEASSGNEQVCSYSWEHLIENAHSPNEQERVEEMCGVYYNDVWVYDTDCLRYADRSCADDGWRILHAGKTFGGCNNDDGEQVCETPSERFGHGATLVDNMTMAVYGGYSQECEDYCSDMWFFNFQTLTWKKQESIGPGARWKFAMISTGSATTSSLYLFGGHRLWHGFSSDNNVENRWNSTALLPEGGYLNDLWLYNFDRTLTDNKRRWSKVKEKETCVRAPGLTWESRNDQQCKVYWPKARSGHAAVYDNKRNGIWIHGGYSSYYPYPTSKDAGSGYGVKSLGREHIAILPSFEFYLDDLWFYDIASGYWERKRIFGRRPEKRTGHIIALSGDILILHGGFADNTHYDDTWHYMIDENRWSKKVHFVHANFPETCTDDLIEIQNDPDCIELQFPADLKRSNESTLALKYQQILPFSEQEGYTPDPNYPLYFGIVDNAETFVNQLRKKYLEQEVYDKKGHRVWIESTVPDGTPIAPKAATSPRQFARLKTIKYNTTTELEIWEWCTSVKGEPTRGKTNDGTNGRSAKNVFIPQPRRQSIGWDGCENIDWKRPSSRSDHSSVYIEKYDMLVTHGGIGYITNNETVSNSAMNRLTNTTVLGDMWVLNVHSCARNCSNNGVCTNGFCKCDPGFYGMDCSNFTCPGSVCQYDGDHVQHCTHCCFDSISDRKVPCRLDDKELMHFTGKSEGICDGFGTCQCAPPYIGEDCSILDCKHNCSFNGYCSVEFPASRCMCKDGYTDGSDGASGRASTAAIFPCGRVIDDKRSFMSSLTSGRMENPSDLLLATPVDPSIKSYASHLTRNEIVQGIYSTHLFDKEHHFSTQFEEIFTDAKNNYPNFVALLIKDRNVYCRRSQLKSLSRSRYFIQMLEQGLLQYYNSARPRNHPNKKIDEMLLNSTVVLPVLLKHDDSNGCYPARKYDKYKVPRLTWSVPLTNENKWCAVVGMPSYKAWRDVSRSIKVDENYWKNEFRKNYKQYPWASKLNMAVWRGSTTFNKGLYGSLDFDDIPRAKLVEKGKESELIDAAFHKLVGKYEDDTQTRTSHKVRNTLKEAIPLKDMMRYKAIIDIDGNNWSARFNSLLCGNSIVIKIKPDFIEQSYKDLEAYGHYVPASIENITETMKYVLDSKNELQMRRIVERANEWCAESMTKEALADSALVAMEEYVDLLSRYDPSWREQGITVQNSDDFVQCH
ncbi:hypothetical protein HJC23_012845 [Cyclotella cryptica]|uniref:EGF-like domain-containing protein n=1 Tax=Cyclotella cryptica TaxID=29204 RepID=A0ABD3Q111_9STRA